MAVGGDVVHHGNCLARLGIGIDENIQVLAGTGADSLAWRHVAQGRAGKWSDIDIALVSDKFAGIRFYDYKKIIPFLREFPSFIEIHPFKKTDFNPSDLFVKEIVESGIRLV